MLDLLTISEDHQAVLPPQHQGLKQQQQQLGFQQQVTAYQRQRLSHSIPLSTAQTHNWTVHSRLQCGCNLLTLTKTSVHYIHSAEQTSIPVNCTFVILMLSTSAKKGIIAFSDTTFIAVPSASNDASLTSPAASSTVYTHALPSVHPSARRYSPPKKSTQRDIQVCSANDRYLPMHFSLTINTKSSLTRFIKSVYLHFNLFECKHRMLQHHLANQHNSVHQIVNRS